MENPALFCFSFHKSLMLWCLTYSTLHHYQALLSFIYFTQQCASAISLPPATYMFVTVVPFSVSSHIYMTVSLAVRLLWWIWEWRWIGERSLSGFFAARCAQCTIEAPGASKRIINAILCFQEDFVARRKWCITETTSGVNLLRDQR